MALTRTVDPASEPVSVELARQQCRVGTAQDTLLELYIAAARELGEHLTQRSFITQTWQLTLDRWPDETDIKLWHAPVLGISSIQYVDTAGVTQTLSNALYALKAEPLPGWVLPAYGTDWPSLLDTADAVIVTFTAGYGAAATDVPSPIRVWMLMKIAAMLENPAALDVSGKVSCLPDRYVDAMLDPFIVPSHY